MSDEVRHQVFVSSTFLDLKDARRAVQQKLLEMDCFPAGMELFSADNDDSWELIRSVIEQSDYYLLIIGGRYGSTTTAGISFTEREYDFAVQLNIPVIAFVHEKPEYLMSKDVDASEDLRKQLRLFKEKIQRSHYYKGWTTPDDLAGHVATAIFRIRKRHPTQGWVRGDNALTYQQFRNIDKMKTRIAQLEQQLELATSSTKSISALASGNDKVELSLSYRYAPDKGRSDVFDFFTQSISAHTTWDELLSTIGPHLIIDCPDYLLLSEFDDYCRKLAIQNLIDNGRAKSDYMGMQSTQSQYEIIRTQFLALGLIQESDRTKSTSDTEPYWKLSDIGRKKLLHQLAFKKSDLPASI